jgi:protein-disulfide isomerase
MNPNLKSLLQSTTAFAGLAVSIFLLAEYALPPAASACPIGGGCHTVRACQVLVPSFVWPGLGTLGFLLLLVLSLSARPRARRLLPYIAALGGVIGLGLLVAQKTVCGAFCPYCVIADASAIATAVLAWLRRDEPVVIAGRRRWAFAAVTVAAAAVSAVWFLRGAGQGMLPSHVEQLPPSVAREQRPNSLTVVEFMDFGCVHCRSLYPELVKALQPYEGRVRMVRKFPRPPSQGSENLARAAYCAEDQGRGEPMAALLIETRNGSRASCEQLAGQAGLDVPKFRACLDAPTTTTRLQEDRRAGREAEIFQMPTLFIGHERFDGATTADRLRASIEKELPMPTAAQPAPGSH